MVTSLKAIKTGKQKVKCFYKGKVSLKLFTDTKRQ